MQSVSFRIWTRVAVSISNDDNDYTMGTSTGVFVDQLKVAILWSWGHCQLSCVNRSFILLEYCIILVIIDQE